MEEEFCHQDEGDEKETRKDQKRGKIKELSMWLFEEEKSSLPELFQSTVFLEESLLCYNTIICNLQLYYQYLSSHSNNDMAYLS